MADERNFRAEPVKDHERLSFFCLHCSEQRAELSSIFAHSKLAHHDPNPVRHYDFRSGQDILALIAAEDAEAERAVRFIDSLRGVDDFLLECGDA